MKRIDVESINNSYETTPCEYAHMILENCSEDTLVVARYDEVDGPGIPIRYDYYDMKWDEECCEAVIREYETLIEKLDEIAGAGYSDEAVENAVIQTVGNAEDYVVSYAKRYCRLKELGAPEVITKNEGRNLILSMITAEYAVSSERIDDTCWMIACAIFGEKLKIKEGKQEEFEEKVGNMIFDLPEEEGIHFLKVFFGIMEEDEPFRVTLRRLRHPVRSRPVRDCTTFGDYK